MERALLEMGQFSQAYDQLMKWIEKTETVLDEVNFYFSLFHFHLKLSCFM